MPIAFTCEQCHRQYEVADDLAGKRGRCKQCGHTFRIPLAQGPIADEIYELEAGGLSSERLAEDPVRSLKTAGIVARVSGLYGLSALPFWGFNLYRGAIVALLAAVLLVGGLTKFVLAMTGLVLCVGPFIGSGFAYRFGIAFRRPGRRLAVHVLCALPHSLPTDAQGSVPEPPCSLADASGFWLAPSQTLLSAGRDPRRAGHGQARAESSLRCRLGPVCWPACKGHRASGYRTQAPGHAPALWFREKTDRHEHTG